MRLYFLRQTGFKQPIQTSDLRIRSLTPRWTTIGVQKDGGFDYNLDIGDGMENCNGYI